jgi:phospholipase C
MADIEHIVVLMLENRSFDCMLGRLYPNDPDFKGLTLQESNTYGGRPIPVWNDSGMNPTNACIPDPDPGELFTDMNTQLFGKTGRSPGTLPDMSGFVENYMQQPAKEGPHDAQAVMHYFTPDQVPVISTLAKAFGVCDQWYASAPCQTWPNRFFVHTGTALGHVDNHTFPVPFPARSIFRLLKDNGNSWRVYFHDMPQSLLLRDIWLSALFHFRLFKQFLADAHTGALPDYSFIEPRYFTDLFASFVPNDEHPPHNVVYGEQLIAAVYNAIRSSPCWKSTLLIITYDEHGGCYDHIDPPTAIPPDPNNQYGFKFDAYGVRVPAVIVSPYIPAGSKIRPTPNADGMTYPFDHTSIIATVRKLFMPHDPPLTFRDGKAPDLLSALTLTVPTNDGPASIAAAAIEPPVAQLATRAAAPPNGMQASLTAGAANLPLSPPATGAAIPPPTPMTPTLYQTVATAAASATTRTNLFLGV